MPVRTQVTPTTVPTGPATTGPGSVITIIGGPNATANIPGPHSDPADFFGSALVLVLIVAAIALTRFVFRRPGRNPPPAEGER